MQAKIHIYPDLYTPYWVLINMYPRNSIIQQVFGEVLGVHDGVYHQHELPKVTFWLWGRPRYRMYHALGRFFPSSIARQPRGCPIPNAICASSESSRRDVSNAGLVWAPALFSSVVEVSSGENRPRDVCVSYIHRHEFWVHFFFCFVKSLFLAEG